MHSRALSSPNTKLRSPFITVLVTIVSVIIMRTTMTKKMDGLVYSRIGNQHILMNVPKSPHHHHERHQYLRREFELAARAAAESPPLVSALLKCPISPHFPPVFLLFSSPPRSLFPSSIIQLFVSVHIMICPQVASQNDRRPPPPSLGQRASQLLQQPLQHNTPRVMGPFDG
jgi:hypothetical protein